MDELLAGNRDAFIEYGIRDAEIVVKYYLHVLGFAREQVGGKRIESGFLPVSAGALAVKMNLKMMETSGLDYEAVFGVASVSRQEWDENRGRPKTVTRAVNDGQRQFHEDFATLCYHGGRNECFYFGPTTLSTWFDYDLSGAYTTGLLTIRPIDYAASFETREGAAFAGGVMGFAWVDFEFPPDTRFPCLPVRNELHGLQFPLRGTTYCTAPELTLALRMGAAITIRRGVIYPWSASDQRIFQPFVEEIRRLRKHFPKRSLSEQYAKLLGNSVYGKTAQGLREKTVFDTNTMESGRVPVSSISNAPMAAHVTGFIRALMGELLAGIPAHRTVVSCTTDGILCDATADELNLSGELAQCFQKLLPSGNMLELKHEVRQAFSFRTRAIGTLIEGENPAVPKEVLAKGSISPPPDCADPNAYFINLGLDREPGQKTLTRPFVSVREQWLKLSDVLRLTRETIMNLEYDFKRCPVNPREMVAGDGLHLAFDTIPWTTEAERERARVTFDSWRKKHCLKSLADWENLQDYRHSCETAKKVRAKKEGGRSM